MDDHELRQEVKRRGLRLRLHHTRDPRDCIGYAVKGGMRVIPVMLTRASLLDENERQVQVADAVCSPRDQPSRRRGRGIALRRLFHRMGWHDLEHSIKVQ